MNIGFKINFTKKGLAETLVFWSGVSISWISATWATKGTTELDGWIATGIFALGILMVRIRFD
jgi:hypothetical protein